MCFVSPAAPINCPFLFYQHGMIIVEVKWPMLLFTSSSICGWGGRSTSSLVALGVNSRVALKMGVLGSVKSIAVDRLAVYPVFSKV